MTLATAVDVATAFDVHVTTARRWLRDGGLPLPTTKRKVEAWRKRMPMARARAAPANVDAALSTAGDAAEPTDEAAHWSTAYRRAKAQSAELALQRQQGESVPRDDVVAMFTQRVTEVRQGLLVLSRRLVGKFPPEMRTELREAVDSECRLLLERYARGDPLLGEDGA